jgi:hypothetical protein
VTRKPGLLLSLCLLALPGLNSCAKTGEPQPPQVLVPMAAQDLEARQYGDRIRLSVSPPALNTNGSRVTTLDRIEWFRATFRRLDPGPLPEDVFLAQADPIGTTAAADMQPFLQNERLVFWDSGPADRSSLYSDGFVYAVRFINRRNQTAGLSNQVFIAPLVIPAAPEGLAFELFPDHIRLVWKTPAKNADGSVPARIAGYNLYRSLDPLALPPLPLNSDPLPDPEFEDRNFQWDTTLYYAVSVIGNRDNPHAESLPSLPLAVRVRDVFPPGMPQNLTALPEKSVVTLLWRPPEDEDLAGYRVFRREEGASAAVLLNPELLATPSFRDDRVVQGKKYEYSVVAVDTHGNESRAAVTTVEVR